MLTLAWRNLRRRRGRSFLTSGAVGVVLLLTLVYFGFGGAATNGVYQNLTETSGHLQVRVAGYRDLRAFSDLLVRDPARVREVLRTDAPDADVVAVCEPTEGASDQEATSSGLSCFSMARLIIGGGSLPRLAPSPPPIFFLTDRSAW